jgi:O-antigen/teichoic acid export membrane protein
MVAFAADGLRLWLGPAFAPHSQSVLRWVAAGMFINSVACIPFSLLQSAGQPRITANIHLFETPLYLAAVWVLTKRLGVEGAAIAFTGRIAVDAVLMFVFADRILQHRPKLMVRLTGAIAASLLVLAAATFLQTPVERVAFCLLALLAFSLAAFMGMAPEERDLIQRFRRKALKLQSSSV